MNTVRNIGKFLLGIVLGALLVLAAEILLIKVWDIIDIRFSNDIGIQFAVNLWFLLLMGVNGYRILKRRDVLLAEGLLCGCIISILVLIYAVFYFYDFFGFI